MLSKDSDKCVESSVVIPNFKNVDTDVPAEDLCKEWDLSRVENGGSLKLEPEFNSSNDEKELGENKEGGIADKFILPEGYQFLPQHFFQCDGILPPLVSSSWLKLLNSDEESGEDSIPLAKLKKTIRKKKSSKENGESATFVSLTNTCEPKSEKRKGKQKSENEYSPIKRKRGRPKKQLTETAPVTKENEYSPIKRKRGRPKKQLTETAPVTKENEFENEELEPFWNDKSDSSECGIQKQDEPDVDFNSSSSNTALTIKYTEHDYFKFIKKEPAEEPEIEDSKGKKKKKAFIQGVRVRNEKVSYPCSECGKSFSAASTLKSHQRIHNGTLLICPECHKGFVSKYLLKCHMRIHNGDLLMCHKCGRGFITAELLKVHSRVHTGDRPFVCNICGKSFPTSSNMLQHKQIHNTERKFLCSKCGSSFAQKRCLDYHMLTHSEKKNICTVCGKLWVRKSDLIEHMRVHTGVKPYCCTICPQKFSQASSLKRHQLVHMDIKPVQCETCNKMYKCEEYYKRHLRKHKKEDQS